MASRGRQHQHRAVAAARDGVDKRAFARVDLWEFRGQLNGVFNGVFEPAELGWLYLHGLVDGHDHRNLADNGTGVCRAGAARVLPERRRWIQHVLEWVHLLDHARELPESVPAPRRLRRDRVPAVHQALRDPPRGRQCADQTRHTLPVLPSRAAVRVTDSAPDAAANATTDIPTDRTADGCSNEPADAAAHRGPDPESHRAWEPAPARPTLLPRRL